MPVHSRHLVPIRNSWYWQFPRGSASIGPGLARPKRRLEEDANCRFERTTALEEIDREVEIYVLPGGQLERCAGVVPGPLQLFRTPALDPLAFGFDVEVKLCRRHLVPFVAACTQCSVKRPDRISPVWGSPA